MTPRIPPLDIEDLDHDTATKLGGINFGRRKRPLNAFLTFANQPEMFSRFLPFGIHTDWSSLPPRERELIILRTSFICGNDYEIVQHTKVGLAAGLTEEEIDRLSVVAEQSVEWEPDDLVLVTAVDQLCTDHDLTDDCWAALLDRWTERFVIDLVFTVGLYVLSCLALSAFRVAAEQP